MKEKIERLSKGIFEYEMPELLISQEKIDVAVEAGNRVSGSFIISNSEAARMKGVLYVTGKALKLAENKFIGIECEMNYTVDAAFMEQGETFSGFISIVSDCGEVQLPYSITVEQACCKSSVGPIRDLFHFANLAQVNWSEARDLFSSPEFYNAVIKNEPKYEVAYQQLLLGPNKEQAMEEFLVLIRKKKSCDFSVSAKTLELSVRNENLMEPLIISKKQWGYMRLAVSSSANYLKLSKANIENEDFVNGQYELRIEVDAVKLKEGTHFSEIVLKNARQTVTIPVICRCRKTDEEPDAWRKTLKRYEYRITEQYLLFRSNVLSSGVYLAESTKLVEAVLRLLDKEYPIRAEQKEWIARLRTGYELYRAYLNIVDGKNRADEEMLQSIFRRKQEYERNDSLLYCAVLYLETMRIRNRDMVDEYAEIIREQLNRNPSEYMLLWFLLYMDRRLEENSELRYESIKDLCSRGCNSPILLYEAAAIWNLEPTTVKRLSRFECKVMHYMIKRGTVSKEAALQFAYLSEQSFGQDKLVLLLLEKLYLLVQHKDILTALCQKIIRMELRKEKYHNYLKQGIHAQLKVNQLYEYCFYTLNQERNQTIDQPVLLYFSYNNTLSEEDTAYLYSVVVKNKDSNPAIYRAYLKKIEQFAVNQMKAGRISSALAVLYADVLRKAIIDREMAQTLPDIIFSYRIICKNPNMRRVCVAHKEEQEALLIPLENNTAMLPIYTENAELFLVDEEGNRYLLSDEDKMFRLMHGEDFLDACYEIGSSNRKLLLHIWEKNKHYNKYETMLIELQKQISSLQGLRAEIISECTIALVDYYYENYEGELLESYLNEVNLQLISEKQRERMLELMILRDMYDKVIAAVQQFGCDNLTPKRLSRLCVRGIHSGKEEADRDILLTMGFFAFRNGRVEDSLLQYLAEQYNGTTGEMYDLWCEAKERGLDTMALEERLLGQMLFAESYVDDSYAVFLSYYHSGMNRKLIRAYISYSAYKYFVKDRVTNPELFEMLKKEPFLENSQICILALLRYYAGKEVLTDTEKTFADYHIQKFEQKKMIFAFFREFEGAIPIPAGMLDKYYIEYRTNPKKKVLLHYCCGEKDQFTVEPMEDIGYGMFTKEIILFFGENLQYFITEGEADSEEITESCSVHCAETEQENTNTKYGRINEILMTRELQDEKTLIDLLENYYKAEYAIKRHFVSL